MADFDAAADIQRSLAVRARIACYHIADVRHLRRFRQVAEPIDAAQMKPRLVGAADEIAHLCHGAVGDNRDLGVDPDRPDVAGHAAQMMAHLGVGCKTER